LGSLKVATEHPVDCKSDYLELKDFLFYSDD